MPIFNLTNGNDTFPSGAINSGDDTINGGDGDDKLYGQAGDDQLNGGDGNDVMDGGIGADAFTGGDGFDTVSYRGAASGISFGFGGGFGDALGDTYDGIERVWGTKFDDTFFSLASGGELWGIEGDDQMYGGNGDDKLNGGIGNDYAQGGGGADEFVISAAGSGNDIIAQFVQGEDHIRIYGVAGVSAYTDLSIVPGGHGVIITFPDGSTIDLDVDSSLISETDFIFGGP